MPFMDISGQQNNYPIVPIALSPSETFILPAGQGIVGAYGGISSPQLGAGNPLTGQYFLQLGQYTVLQQYDVGMQYWQNVSVVPLNLVTISSDGANWRIANSTGCPVGAVITNAGAATGTNGFYGYTSFGAGTTSQVTIQNGVISSGNTTFTVTPSAGGTQWNAIIGGSVNTGMTFSGASNVYNGNYGVNGAFGATTGGVLPSAGANYTKPPIIVFTPPPNQGQQPYILPTATCGIVGGAINAIVVVDQGAGLLGLPGVTVIPAPGDTTGGGAVIGWTSVYNNNVNSGQLAALWPANYGSGPALTFVPSLTFGGSAVPTACAATVIMNFTVTGVGGTAGAGYGTTPGGVVNGGYCLATPAANTSTRYAQAISVPLYPQFTVTTATGVPVLPTGGFTGVNLQVAPTYCAIPNGTAAPTTANASTFTVGGATDVCKLMTF